VIAILYKLKTCANVLINALASIKFAVTLILLLAAAIAYGTIVETKYGRPYSQWFVYHSSWFLVLLGLLGASVFSAAYVRFPWKRHQTGFVITHAGLLVLLGGSIVSYWYGIEGQMVLVEGRTSNQLVLNDCSQITASSVKQSHERPYVFTFESGPVDWKSSRTMHIGSVDGMSARVLHYFQESEPVEHWIEDRDGRGGPLLRFQIQSPNGGHTEMGLKANATVDGVLADQDYGAETLFGPIAIRLQRATSDAMLADFLHPSEQQLGEKGVLTAYYQDAVEHVSVDQQLGKTVAIGKTGANIELVQYLSNATLDPAGQFQSVGFDARNPLVELKVHLPGEGQAYRQVSYAKSPLLNFDGVYARECPVKFAYQHPKLKQKGAVEFLQARDGKLYGRMISDGKCKSLGEVTNSSRCTIQSGFGFRVTQYLPHAIRDVSFNSVKHEGKEEASDLAAAAEVEITIGGQTKTLWIQRNSLEFQSRTIDTPAGPLRVQFSAAQIPLGFSVELLKFKREMNPGQVGNASYASEVRVLDQDRRFNEDRLISMNAPLVHRGFRFYQSSFQDAGHGKEASILSVAYDPGRAPKYMGSLMVCAGIVTMFYMRAYTFRNAQHCEPKVRDDDASANLARQKCA
jgi:hypothetical protein